MARKVFISVLGTGLYEKCKYVKGDFRSSETTFVQLATLEYLRHLSCWTEDFRAYILLTDKARKENWEVEAGQRHHSQKNTSIPYVGLRQTIENASFPFTVEGVSIPDGKDGKEMWQIFETAFKLLEDGDELYFDLTHSFRYLPMLILVLGNYAKFLKNATVCSITYGNYEARNQEVNEAPIVDLLPLSTLQDWTFATADFLKNGYVDRLVELSDKGLNPLMRNEETRTPDTKRLKSFVKNLSSFTSDLQTCRGLSIIEASTTKRIYSDIDALNTVVIPQLEPVLKKVEEAIEPFDSPNDVYNAFKAAQWCYDNQQYQQATTFLEEGIISFFCQRHGIALDNRRQRELVTSAFTIIGQEIPQEQWKVEKPEWMDLLVNIIDDKLLKEQSLVNAFNSFSQLRNDYNHCGMRVMALKPDQIKEKIKKYLDTIIPLLQDEEDVSYAKVSKYFVNLSNHPSKYWSEEQLSAAKEYGEIKDMAFPVVDSNANEEDIQLLADQYVREILSLAGNEHVTVHIMGEMTFVYYVVSQLKDNGIKCIASTTDRDTMYTSEGKKVSDFHFVRFRSY